MVSLYIFLSVMLNMIIRSDSFTDSINTLNEKPSNKISTVPSLPRVGQGHRLRPIDTHLALYTMLYNNSANIAEILYSIVYSGR